MINGSLYLFVYGTLRSGAEGGAAALLSDCERVGPGTVRGTLYDLGGFPALLLSGDDEVRGEVWRCPSGLLPELDRYEGVEEGLFRRAAVQVGRHACWVYVAGPKLGARLAPGARVPEGVWEK